MTLCLVPSGGRQRQIYISEYSKLAQNEYKNRDGWLGMRQETEISSEN